jgi:hypothetical protein
VAVVCVSGIHRVCLDSLLSTNCICATCASLRMLAGDRVCAGFGLMDMYLVGCSILPKQLWFGVSHCTGPNCPGQSGFAWQVGRLWACVVSCLVGRNTKIVFGSRHLTAVQPYGCSSLDSLVLGSSW